MDNVIKDHDTPIVDKHKITTTIKDNNNEERGKTNGQDMIATRR